MGVRQLRVILVDDDGNYRTHVLDSLVSRVSSLEHEDKPK